MRYLIWISRIITGLVFIFSGTVKAIDPLGSAYKFQDYFQAFHIGFLKFLGLPLSFLLFTTEFIAGFSVLTGIRYKTGTWLVLIMMLIFTPLTLILALTNPVSDCGCFGDAVHLTNWQTFGKNVILLALAIFLFRRRNHEYTISRVAPGRMILPSVTILFLAFAVYNLLFLPVIDFLPYKKGTDIKEGMTIPPGAAPDEYYSTFIYEKDGVQKEFTLENYPADDSTWKFVDQKTRLIKKCYQPPIHDFTIITAGNEDITGMILSDPGYTLLMITRKPSRVRQGVLQEGFEIGRYLKDTAVDFYILTSSGPDEIKTYVSGLNFGFMDETTLKTMIRSDPGYILLKNGRIIGKWSWANVPGKEEFSAPEKAFRGD